jgi:Uma2 family endonuclease
MQMTTTTTRLMTAEELLRMPEDGTRYELVRGRLVAMPPPGNIHGKRTMRLGWRLAQHVETNDLGVVFAAETGFQLASDPDTVRGVDIAFVSKERADAAGEVEGYWPGAPDLAVEVISPNDTYTQVEEKVADEYLEAGTRAVWVLNPRRRTVTIYRSLTEITILTEQDGLEGGDVVPGFRCPVSEIFA